MKKLIVLILISFAIGCNVQFVPTKSQTALNMVSQIQFDANKAFAEFNYNEDFYTQTSNEIDSLKAFDKSRAKSKVISNQDEAIERMFNEFWIEHRNKGKISNSESQLYKVYFKSVIDPRIISENSLK